MRRDPLVVADNEIPEEEPEGFWTPVHEQVALWADDDAD
jgi:hypothetical protein